MKWMDNTSPNVARGALPAGEEGRHVRAASRFLSPGSLDTLHFVPHHSRGRLLSRRVENDNSQSLSKTSLLKLDEEVARQGNKKLLLEFEDTSTVVSSFNEIGRYKTVPVTTS